MNYSFAFRLIAALIIIGGGASFAHAYCTWEDKNGIFHMTDDRSQAPPNSKCDGEEPAQPSRKSVTSPVSKPASTTWATYKSQFAPGELGFDDDANQIKYDRSRITLDPEFPMENTPNGKRYRILVPISIDYFGHSGPIRNTFEVKVECGPLRNHDSGIQAYGRINLSKEQKRLLRENACEDLKP